MVFYGYQLPKSNVDVRLLNLNLGLKNNALRLVNSKLLIDSINDIKKNVDKATLSSQTQSDPNALIDLAVLDQKSLESLARERNISNASMSNLDSSNISDISMPSAISQPITAKERATASALSSAIERAKQEGRVLTKQEEEDVKTNINKQSNLLSGLKDRANKDLINNMNIENARRDKEGLPRVDINFQPIDDGTEQKAPVPSTIPTMVSTWISSTSTGFNDLSDEQKDAINAVDNIKKIKNEEEFIKYFINLKKRAIVKLDSDGRRKQFFSAYTLEPSVKNSKGEITKLQRLSGPIGITGATGEKTIKKMYNAYNYDNNLFLDNMRNSVMAHYGATWGNGLISGGQVVPNYKRLSDQVANFGNLYLSEPPLKKNNLTIYRPKSKLTLISKRNISNTLKKMIFDIQNTLEFDESDYSNLADDEKRIIEKIIRYQQKMKNYNIEKLIDNDDTKIKNRLEILTAQINAGNNSGLIREEMKVLVKSLLKNGAISHGKYYSLVKSIDALAK